MIQIVLNINRKTLTIVGESMLQASNSNPSATAGITGWLYACMSQCYGMRVSTPDSDLIVTDDTTVGANSAEHNEVAAKDQRESTGDKDDDKSMIQIQLSDQDDGSDHAFHILGKDGDESSDTEQYSAHTSSTRHGVKYTLN